MSHTPTIILTGISALMMLVGVVLSAWGAAFRLKEKPLLVLNSEIGLIVIQALSFLSTTAQLLDMMDTPADQKMTVWVPTVIVRVLFFWVPLNYFLYVRSEKKKLKNVNN